MQLNGPKKRQLGDITCPCRPTCLFEIFTVVNMGLFVLLVQPSCRREVGEKTNPCDVAGTDKCNLMKVITT